MDDKLIQTARMLAARLERLSADSIWARRSSGLRGSLLKWLEKYEGGAAVQERDLQHLQSLLDKGFDMLVRGGREIEVPGRR